MKEKRVFKTERLYKLIKWIVNIVSILLILFAVTGYFEYDSYEKRMLNGAEECGKKYNILDCTIWFKWIDDYVHSHLVAFGIGIGLLVVFYGGTVLYKYLFPKVTETVVGKSIPAKV